LACWTMSFHFFLSLSFSIFSLPALEDLLLLALSIFIWVFLSVLSLLVVGWRSLWAFCLPPFSPGVPASLFFALLSVLLYFLLYWSLLVLYLSYFPILHFNFLDHIFFGIFSFRRLVALLPSFMLPNFTDIRPVSYCYSIFDNTLCLCTVQGSYTHHQHSYLVTTFLSDHLHGYMFRPLSGNFADN
jgi:hypothetical protein